MALHERKRIIPGSRRLRILALLPSHPKPEPSTSRLCEVAAEITSMTGTGIMLMSGRMARGSLCSSDRVSSKIEDLQFTLGEGPCVEAYNEAWPVTEPDLADPDLARWPAFTPLALEARARAVFGFPMETGRVRLGALNLSRDQPGPLTPEQHADSLVMADVAARAVVAMQASAPDGALPAELESLASLQAVVHQASGMVSAQLGVSVNESLVRLRVFAFSHDSSLYDVAKEVVGRRLRFDEL